MDCNCSGVDIDTSMDDLEEKKLLLNSAIEKIRDVRKLLHWHHSPSLITLTQEVDSLHDYYAFLLTTQTTVFSTHLGYFSVLPMEVLMLIFGYLDVNGMCKMTCVCKQFSVIGEDEGLWRKLAHRFLDTQQIEHKPTKRSWRWLVRATLRIFKEGEVKDEPGTYVWVLNPSQTEDGRTLADTSRYSGDWKENKRHGFGTYYWSNGSLYTGEWFDDKREGFGTRVWPNKNRYTGEYQNHKRHGTGEFTFSNGSVFTGTFEDNKFIKGTYTWPNGRVYNGEWNNIFRHGKGSYWWPDGRTYVGDWRNDKRHGTGVYSWPDGDSFEGKFHEGRRLGHGVLKLAAGEVFDQEWNEEKFEEFNKGIEPMVDSSGLQQPTVCRKRKNPDEPELNGYKPKRNRKL